MNAGAPGRKVSDEVARFAKAFDGIEDAFRRLGDAAAKWEMPTVEPVDRAELSRRRDEARRYASAALGRGDRKGHRRAVAEVRRLDQLLGKAK